MTDMTWGGCFRFERGMRQVRAASGVRLTPLESLPWGAAACRLGRRSQYGDDFGVFDLGKITIELTDRGKVLGCIQAYDLVGQRLHPAQGVGRRYRHCRDQPLRLSGAHRTQRRNHGRSRGQSVVDHDHHPVRRIDRRPHRRIPRTPGAHHRKLLLPLCFQVLLGCSGAACMVGNVGPALLVHRADRKLGVVRRADLAHQHHIKFTAQHVGDHATHRHRSAGDRKHQRILSLVPDQMPHQLTRCIVPVAKNHGCTPHSADTALTPWQCRPITCPPAIDRARAQPPEAICSAFR